MFDRARAHGLPVKLHAEQLSNLGGAALAASYGALSADHLEYLDEAGVAAMAAAGTVAVLLPGAFYMLRETRLPPVAALRAAGVPIAVATDCNPGTSPLASLLLAMNMACTLFRLTPEEALAGVTRMAARALGLDDCGAIAPGMRADLAVWDAGHPAELAYRIGWNPLAWRIFGRRTMADPRHNLRDVYPPDRAGDQLQELADRGGAADADEQPRPGRRRAAGGAGGLRRHRPGGAQLGGFDAIVATLQAAGGRTRRCWCSRASRWGCSGRTRTRRGC